MRVPPVCKLESQIKIGAFLDHTAEILRAQVCHDFIGQRLVAVREDDDCACGKESVSRSAGLARGTMPPPSRIAESRDMCVSRKTGFMRKLGKLPVRAIFTLRPSRTLYNAVATLHVSEACPSVSASSNNYVCLLGARAAGVFLSRMTAGFVSVEYASAWCLFPAS